MPPVESDAPMCDVALYPGHFHFKYHRAFPFLQECFQGLSTIASVTHVLVDGEMLDVHKVGEVPIGKETDGLVEIPYQQAMELWVVVGIGTLLFVVPPFFFRKGGLEQLLYEEIVCMASMDVL